MYEMKLMGTYGLRNKRELWKTATMVRYYRHRARSLLATPPEIREKEEKALLNRLIKLGLLKEGARLDDVLNLKIEDLLERRLQTIVYKKGLAKTLHEARQLIVHGHIAIGGRRVRSPGRIVTVDEEPLVDYYPFSPLKQRISQEAQA
ncbi:30S ribosomal protein S4P [Desulfurococcus amylolyticus 1221n]|uniref:30S ribosomal protein S4P n=2 Tax=Desulfurococcaceae TaxID=2272 RepID=B8D6G0_DESA1|nr:30S ribosomal protein S4P [Desulfurococcus amylolyticus 1221n]